VKLSKTHIEGDGRMVKILRKWFGTSESEKKDSNPSTSYTAVRWSGDGGLAHPAWVASMKKWPPKKRLF